MGSSGRILPRRSGTKEEKNDQRPRFHPALEARRWLPMGHRVSDQPHRYAALGKDPIATIGREELKARLDRGELIKLIMALNRWAFDAKHIPCLLYTSPSPR